MHLPMQEASFLKLINQCTGASQLQHFGLYHYDQLSQSSPKEILPKLSFSWWVLLGSLGPGTPGDSCFGTYCTPAAATRIMGKSIGTETLERMQNLGHFHFTLDPLFRETGEVATK